MLLESRECEECGAYVAVPPDIPAEAEVQCHEHREPEPPPRPPSRAHAASLAAVLTAEDFLPAEYLRDPGPVDHPF